MTVATQIKHHPVTSRRMIHGRNGTRLAYFRAAKKVGQCVMAGQPKHAIYCAQVSLIFTSSPGQGEVHFINRMRSSPRIRCSGPLRTGVGPALGWASRRLNLRLDRCGPLQVVEDFMPLCPFPAVYSTVQYCTVL